MRRAVGLVVLPIPSAPNHASLVNNSGARVYLRRVFRGRGNPDQSGEQELRIWLLKYATIRRDASVGGEIATACAAPPSRTSRSQRQGSICPGIATWEVDESNGSSVTV